jgi:DNA polymerase
MAERGPLCFYLHHAGAHTLRPTGGDKINGLNFPRGGAIRKAICAPVDKLLSVVDYRQFELRILLWLAGQKDKLELIRQGANLYCDFGNNLYGRKITKENKEEYHFCKTIVLGAGYGAGTEKIYNECKAGGINITERDAEYAKIVYRKNEYPLVPKLWREAEVVLRRLYNGDTFNWKCFRIEDKKVYSPTGSFMFFDHLHWNEEKGEWKVETRPGKWSKMYGSKFIENVVQFLQRCIAAEALIKIPKEIPLILWPYDEFVHILDEKTAQIDHTLIKTIMCEVPVWAKGLPIGVEGGIYERYEK